MSASPKLTALIAELKRKGQLPALDTNVNAICSLTGDPTSCTSELTTVILRDAALTSSIISTANSVLFQAGEPVKTVSSATSS